jgi:hypothetical protein
MHKMKEQLGNWGLMFVSLLLLAVVCAVAIADPRAFAGLMVVMLLGIAAMSALGPLARLGMRGAIGWTTGTEKSLECTAAIATNYTIAKHGADDDHASLATAATDNLIGIFQHITTTADDMVKIMLSGISPVVYGGAVTRGDPLTSNATGQAIVATAGQSIIGYATISGVLNDIGYCEIIPQRLPSNAGADGLVMKGLARATFDATGGKAIASYGLGVILPDNAIITRSWYDVITTFTSAGADAGTIALSIPTNDVAGIVAATAISAGGNIWDAGLHEGIQDGAATNMSVKTTAARELTADVAVQDLTAGKLVLFCEYVISL